ncbi:hypothetical protein Tco_0883694 [Tanacetum coccineum]
MYPLTMYEVRIEPLTSVSRRVGFLRYGSVKNHKKTVKNGQARTRESEEFKKKPKIQSRSQKSQASVKSSQNTMGDMNIHAKCSAEQASAIAPPTRTDDQILPSSKWVPIGKSNCVLDVQKSQRNPIFPIVVAILKNTNFFRAFTASSTIPAIYIQQF